MFTLEEPAVAASRKRVNIGTREGLSPWKLLAEANTTRRDQTKQKRLARRNLQTGKNFSLSLSFFFNWEGEKNNNDYITKKKDKKEKKTKQTRYLLCMIENCYNSYVGRSFGWCARAARKKETWLTLIKLVQESKTRMKKEINLFKTIEHQLDFV